MALARVKLGLILLLGVVATAIGAGRPPAAQPEAGAKDTGAQKPARTDRHGDPLPEGVLARLGTLRLRAVGAQVALSPDGKIILTLTKGRHLKLWDADTGKLRGQRELPVQPSDTAFLSPDGRFLAVQEPESNRPIDVWDVTAEKGLHRLPLPQFQRVYRAVFSLDGKLLAVTANGDDLIHVWDLGSGNQQLLRFQRGAPGILAFSPDGKLFAATDNYSVICWRIAKGAQLWRAKAHIGRSLGFSPDGRTLIATPSFRERSWHAWDTATGRPAEGLKLPERYHDSVLAVAPDGRTLVFAPYPGIEGPDGRIRLWDLRSGKLLRTLSGGGRIGPIGPFSPDGRSFLTNDGSLQRWELATGRPLLPDTDGLGHHTEVHAVVYSPDSRLLASTANDGTVRLWEAVTAKPLHVLRSPECRLLDVTFSADGKRLFSGGDAGEVRVWDNEAGRELGHIPLADPQRGEKKLWITRLHPTPDGRMILELGYDPTVLNGGATEILTSLDLATGRRKGRAEIRPSWGPLCAFSPDGRALASRAVLLDTTTGKERVKLEGAADLFGYRAFSPDGRLVAGLVSRTETDGMMTSSKPVGIRIWDTASGRAVNDIPTDDFVAQLAFSPDGRYLSAADGDGIRLWELATGQVVQRHKAHEPARGSNRDSFASCLAYAPDGRTLATGHPDSSILLWSLVPPLRHPDAGNLTCLWDDLASPDAARAYAASWQLTDVPKQTLPLLRKHLRPASPAPAEQVRALVADLDSNEFRKREAASARLRELGDGAKGALREALSANPSAEKRRRVELLLKALDGPPTGEFLRVLRAVTVLERVGTPAAALLKELAGGDSAARLTHEAKASLERLGRRPTSRP
jgi:WD40 repeat protein